MATDASLKISYNSVIKLENQFSSFRIAPRMRLGSLFLDACLMVQVSQPNSNKCSDGCPRYVEFSLPEYIFKVLGMGFLPTLCFDHVPVIGRLPVSLAPPHGIQ